MIRPDPEFATEYAAKQRRSRRAVRILVVALLLIGVGGILAMAGIAAVVVVAVSIVSSFNGLGELIAASIFSLVVVCLLIAICWLLVLLSAGQILETIGLIVWFVSMYLGSR